MPAETTLSVTAADETATRALAAALARQCRPGDCVLLEGELGAGKTAFARGFIQALEPAHNDVVSPTFTLVQTYPTPAATVWHFDLYRLRHSAELSELGLEEALKAGISLIEWSGMAQSALPPDVLTVTIRPGKHASERRIDLSGRRDAWQARLDALKGER